MKHTAPGESLVTNIALGFASCYICHLTLTSAVYFIQTGCGALSNTYNAVIVGKIFAPRANYVVLTIF